MKRFFVSFNHAGATYQGFIQPITKRKSKAMPIKYFAWLNNSCYEVIYYFRFECQERPDLSERLGELIVRWWKGEGR